MDSEIKYREVKKIVPRCGVCGGPRSHSGAQVCASCYSNPDVRRDYVNQGATKDFSFDIWETEVAFVEVKPRLLPWATPTLELIWWTPTVVEASPDECGWRIVQFLEDIPTVRIMVAGEDYEPMIVRRVTTNRYYPWETKDRFIRWDQFDWWTPLTDGGVA